MSFDARWLDALKLPLKTTIPVALAASLLLALDWWGALDLGWLTAYTRPVLIIIFVVYWTLAVVGVADYFWAFHEKRRYLCKVCKDKPADCVCYRAGK